MGRLQGRVAIVTGNTLFADGGSHINGVSWTPALAEDA